MRNFIFLSLTIFLLVGCSSFKIVPDYVFDSLHKKELYIKSYDETLKLWDVRLKN